jgi:hypothetical protein
VHFVPPGEVCGTVPPRDRMRVAVLDLGDVLAPRLYLAVRNAIEALPGDGDYGEYLGAARIARLREGGVAAVGAIAPDWSDSQGPDTYRVAFDSVGDVSLWIDPRSGRHEWSVRIE